MFMKYVSLLCILMMGMCLAGAAFAQANDIPQNTHKNIMKADNGIVLSVENVPKTAEKGHNLTFTYVISNTGKTVYNMRIFGQCINKELGILLPGKTIRVPISLYLETDEELREIYGPGNHYDNDQTIVGGDGLEFKDNRGMVHTLYFDSFVIQLDGGA